MTKVLKVGDHVAWDSEAGHVGGTIVKKHTKDIAYKGYTHLACEKELPRGPRPVLRAAESARILVVGHAPGARVHASAIPWDDASGARLRDWMGVNIGRFCDESRMAIIPMGDCYRGWEE